MVPYFEVTNRNPGHWDIYSKNRRMFCIRGEAGMYYIRDERKTVDERAEIQYKSIPACMAYIVDELMFEDA